LLTLISEPHKLTKKIKPIHVHEKVPDKPLRQENLLPKTDKYDLSSHEEFK
jgi:hypothetical protein